MKTTTDSAQRQLMDLVLINNIVSGQDVDRNFADLYKRYRGLVGSIIFSVTHNPNIIDDLTQDAFLKVYVGLKSYKPELCSFKTWLGNLVDNICVDYIRYQMSSHRNGVKVTLNPNQAHYNGYSPIDHAELAVVLEDAIDSYLEKTKIPEGNKKAMRMILGGSTYEHAATSQSISIGTVKGQYFRVRENVKAHITRVYA